MFHNVPNIDFDDYVNTVIHDHYHFEIHMKETIYKMEGDKMLSVSPQVNDKSN